MKFKKDVFFCWDCANVFLSLEAAQHPCHVPLRITRTSVTFEMKRTRWDRFISWLYGRDINLGLAIIGLILMNTILIIHFNFNITEGLVQGFGLGLAIPRLLK